MSPVLNSWSGAGGLCNCLAVLLAICIAGSALVAQPAAALAPAPYGEQFVRVGGSWPDGEAAPPGAVSDSIDPGANEQSLQRELLIHEQAAGPYADALAEPLASLGRQYSLQGDYVQAQRAYQRALHIVRVNDGLYSDRQLPVLKELLNTHRAVGDVQALDDRYEYIFRLYGSGQPPYTELRLGAAVEYLRWQREALRMGADKSDRTHSRLLAMFQLNQQLLDDVAADGNVAFAAYRELGLSQLRNLYLIQDRVQPRIETIGSAPEVPIVRCIRRATARTTTCMMPRWYATVMSDEKKMIVGRTLNAKAAPVRATWSGRAAKPPWPDGPTRPSGVTQFRTDEGRR